MLQELTEFERSLVPHIDDAALRELVELIRAQVELLEQATGQASKRAMNASSRLRLERRVMDVARQLSGALPLAEALREAATPATQTFDLLELLQLTRSGDQPQTPGARQVQGHVASSVASVPVRCGPRLFLGLIALSGSLVEGEDLAADLSIELSAEGGRSRVTIEPKPGRGAPVTLLVPRRVDATRSCVLAAARAAGLECELGQGSVHFQWSLA